MASNFTQTLLSIILWTIVTYYCLVILALSPIESASDENYYRFKPSQITLLFPKTIMYNMGNSLTTYCSDTAICNQSITAHSTLD